MIRSSLQSPSQPLANQRLSDQLADDLRRQIEGGLVQPGERLPTEQALAAQYAVSRTVVREAVSRLRSSGLLVARQGSGMFVAALDAARPLDFDSSVLANLGAVLDVVEVRRALESEVAALAAVRATAAQRAAIQDALALADASIASGSATVDEDLAFHQAVAEAAGNPQFPRLLRHLEQYLREAMTVTRRNESMKQDFITQVRQEHQAIADAILARDADAARAAATRHMHEAARRLHDSDAPIRRTAATAKRDTP
ncbi:FadR/GntR family transcriptional regulator [Pseudaquabacterium pictum]|uniref:GntR family transcriptional regulator n=1 Tax=Pseudaquabacterium pictum TaxID=2315236 RepID=A0A480AQA1_9BURK|nr:FCD domain-containing protein [Rubrivivax pictus]GCL63593.1 GntR family transcriptional regulator [Rubrivivax pictus]